MGTVVPHNPQPLLAVCLYVLAHPRDEAIVSDALLELSGDLPAGMDAAGHEAEAEAQEEHQVGE